MGTYKAGVGGASEGNPQPVLQTDSEFPVKEVEVQRGRRDGFEPVPRVRNGG